MLHRSVRHRTGILAARRFRTQRRRLQRENVLGVRPMARSDRRCEDLGNLPILSESADRSVSPRDRRQGEPSRSRVHPRSRPSENHQPSGYGFCSILGPVIAAVFDGNGMGKSRTIDLPQFGHVAAETFSRARGTTSISICVQCFVAPMVRWRRSRTRSVSPALWDRSESRLLPIGRRRRDAQKLRKRHAASPN